MSNVFLDIAEAMRTWLLGMGLQQTTVEFAMVLVKAGAVLGIISLAAMILVLHERKFAGYIQQRPGPNRLGPGGIFQTFADTLKLLGKEDIVPKAADKWMFVMAPVLIFVPAMLLYVVIPFGEGLTVVDLELGVFYFIAISSLTTIPLIMAGWAQNNKYSLLGGMRAVAQMVSYELPLVFSVLGVVMIAGSMRMSDIVLAQSGLWFVVLQPVAFIIFIIAAAAELNRAPFDLPEGETELTAGIFTEYTGMKFALFFMAEYANLFILSAFAVTMFLGGWHAPFGLTFIPSYVWFFIKVFLFISMFMWFRWTFPRIRVDQLMHFGWKILLPASIVNLFVTAIGLYVFQIL
ncbi:NADH-quinone oxidoreductase subunit H [Desulfitispora alkaliphila]|uniref:NADH-quinone oxidoreductase subunit NuoH n=1 Tax=Desulfitispora alkaliphila TaxID=622674 RepID=UPI003D1F7945